MKGFHFFFKRMKSVNFVYIVLAVYIVVFFLYNIHKIDYSKIVSFNSGYEKGKALSMKPGVGAVSKSIEAIDEELPTILKNKGEDSSTTLSPEVSNPEYSSSLNDGGSAGDGIDLKILSENKYWTLDTNLSHFETSVNIPSFYHDESREKKEQRQKMLIQPYDPRLTMGVYVNYLNEELNKRKDFQSGDKGDAIDIHVPFHWSDWVDLTILTKYLLISEKNKPGCEILNLNYPNKEQVSSRHSSNAKREDSIDTLPEDSFCINDNELDSKYYNQEEEENIFINDLVKPGFNVFASPGRSSGNIIELAGKSYLYTFAPIPNRLIFLSKTGSYNYLKPNTSMNLLSSRLVDGYLKNLNTNPNRKSKTTIDPLEEFSILNNENPPPSHDSFNAYELQIPKESFKVDYGKIISDYKEVANKSYSQINYLNSLEYSRDIHKTVRGPPKYFQEARLLFTESSENYGDHYDWRFFRGVIVGTKMQELVLHRLIRSWLSFCSSNGFHTWIAHGSLLSWYWNGVGFPWDNDIDVQMPILDLYKLAENFNQSLIIEDLKNGLSGKYFLDISTFITERSKGNGNNNIDARFIDIDTGLYIDITGLSISDRGDLPERYNQMIDRERRTSLSFTEKVTELQVYNCKNNHYALYDELNPLFMTKVEGQLAYVPRKFKSILKNEYSENSLREKHFNGYLFIDELRLWVQDNIIENYFKNKALWNLDNKVPNKTLGASDAPSLKSESLASESIKSFKSFLKLKNLDKKNLDFTIQDLINMLYNDEILLTFFNLNEFTKLHREEKSLLDSGESTQETILESQIYNDNLPLRIDLFIYLNRINGYNYDEEIEKFVQLNNNFAGNENQ